MKRILLAFALLAAALTPAGAQAASALKITFTWTTSAAAATVTTNTTTGAEISGPVLSSLYIAPATVTSGVASCPAYVAGGATYTLVGTVAGTSSAANANSLAYTTGTVGTVYCAAVTDQFQAGGPVSAAVLSTPIDLIILGTAAAPTSVAGSVSVQ